MTKEKRIVVRMTKVEYDRLIVIQKELNCHTISETVIQMLNDDVIQKLKVIYRKPIVAEILKTHGIDLKTFDWKNYKPIIEVKNVW
jgi:hypothetical protein